MRTEYKSIEDFMTDAEFRSWAIAPQRDSEELWVAWLKSNPEMKLEFMQAKELIQSLEFNPVNKNEKAYDRVLQNILKNQRRSVKIANTRPLIRFWNYSLRVAAVLTLAFGLSYVAYQVFEQTPKVGSKDFAKITRETPAGHKVQISLPDGTLVSMNAGSKLSYYEQFSGKERLVELEEGEAYFEVVKNPDKPFVVKSGNVLVTALGTVFNVKAYKEDENIGVSLLEGKVIVKGNAESEHGVMHEAILTQGQGVLLTKESGQMERIMFDHELISAWRNKTIYFKDASFKKVIRELERWYGVQFEVVNINNIDAWNFTSEYKNQTLENVLHSISYSKNFDFEIKGEKVIINIKPK